MNKLKRVPEGLRYSALVSSVEATNKWFNKNTIHGNVWNLDQTCPDKVYKPSRGLFRLTEFKEPESDQLKRDLVKPIPKKVKEEEFYAPFADWLQNDLEECTKTIPLGGNR